MELCPVSDTQLPSHCIYKWRAADFDSREPQPQCFRKFWSKKSLKKSKNSMKFQLPQFQLHQHCWKSRTNTQRNWHCLPKPVSSKFLSKLDKKKNLIHFPNPASRNFDVHEELHSSLVHDTEKEDHEKTMVFGGNETVKHLQSSPSSPSSERWLLCWCQIELYE